MASIGENIRKIRKEKSISQSELARMVGKTRSAISQYESGTIVPRMGVIEHMAVALDVSSIAMRSFGPRSRWSRRPWTRYLSAVRSMLDRPEARRALQRRE